MKKIPQRMCVSCRTRKNKKELLRVVLMPDGQVTVDPTGKKPGRGAYVCKNNECLTQAVKAHRFDKGLKTQVPPELIAELLTDAESYNDESDTMLGG